MIEHLITTRKFTHTLSMRAVTDYCFYYITDGKCLLVSTHGNMDDVIDEVSEFAKANNIDLKTSPSIPQAFITRTRPNNDPEHVSGVYTAIYS